MTNLIPLRSLFIVTFLILLTSACVRCNNSMVSGNVIMYGSGLSSQSIVKSHSGEYDVNLGKHLEQHTKQSEKYGILFVPMYYWHGGNIKTNPLEIEADEKARIE